uniref:Tetraspanin n=1 Tax=Mola mola TaxID=94237 RepID=A0A3Q4ADL3_MOLML
MSKVQGGMKCVKYLLFVFNFIFWVNIKMLIILPFLFLAVYILLGAGGLMMVVGFFGCFGAVRESQCLLASFFACLLIIFGAEIAAGVFGFINKEQIVEEVQKFYSSSIADVSSSNGTAIALIYHKTLNCCGGSTSDMSTALCAEAPEDTKDCLAAITDFFNDKLHIIGYIGIGVAGVMIIGMIFSMVLCCAIRNNREVI